MEFEPSGITSSRHRLRPGQLDTSTSEESAPGRNNAVRDSLTFLIAAAIAFLGELYLAIESQAWQVFGLAGIGAVVTGLAARSVRLTRQGRFEAGIWLLIGALLTSVLLTPFLVAGFGLVLGLGTILVVLNIALQTLPQKAANWALLSCVSAAIIAGGLDLLSPPTQLTLPAFQTLILIVGSGIVLFYGAVTVRQFSTFPLTTKLILAFFAVSLAPVGVLAFFNYRHTRTVLTEEAQQALLAAVSKTASDVDSFVNDQSDAIQTEAQLPVLAAYLKLPAERRSGSAEEAAARETLQELSLKDKVYIVSYAVLDGQGQNVIDTDPASLGRDESARGYFQKPIETGLAYVSPVQFSGPVEAKAGSTGDRAALTFSSAIRDTATQETLGVLRVAYRPAILQQLIVQNNGLVGEQSFAVLFDENNIRLAHGAAPDLIFQPVMPLAPAQLATLQTAGRLPAGVESPPTTNLPDLAEGLSDAIFEPHFTARLDPAGERSYLAVVKELESQPWSVLFAQPQDLFLSPIQAQTRITLFLAIAIAGCITAAAFAMGQYLANPLVELTRTVTRFTEGDLEARTSLISNDERGVLAASFNKMAEQVGSLVKSLAERTHELEAEAGERQRAEIDLQASEQKYRRLFEESRDVIFITTTDGQIVDINPRGLIQFGYATAELKRMNITELYLDPDRRLAFRREIDEQGSVRDFAVQFRRKDNEIRSCLVTATVWLADNGQILGYQGIIRDITEQEQVEKEHLRLLAIEQELTLAQEIQQNLLPSPQPDWDGPDLVCYSMPAREMGGDLYAYHAFDGNRFAVTVGDVSGKGMPAALLMAVSVASFRAVVGQGLTPSDLLAHLDQTIAPYTATTGQNCALVYVEIRLEAGRHRLCVANAGCMAPLVRRTDHSVLWSEAYGTPLGTRLSSEFGYQEFKLSLSPGDLVILTSDGVVEAINSRHEMFGFERLEQAVATGPTASAAAMLDHLRSQVDAFIDGAEPNDDLTIVVVQV